MSCYKPKTKDKYLGIEIEFYSKYSTDYIETLFNKNKILKSFCKLGEDSSINTDYSDGLELRILTKQKNLKVKMNIVQDFLKLIDAEVNNSCGLHIHLDARHYDPTKMLKNLINNLDGIEKSVPSYRLNNNYSNSIKHVSDKMLEMIKHYREGKKNTVYNHNGLHYYYTYLVPGYTECRYRSINIESILEHKTIEVRCHEGTTSCAEIYKWCKYLSEVAYEGKISETNQNYIKKRIITKGKYEAKRITQ